MTNQAETSQPTGAAWLLMVAGLFLVLGGVLFALPLGERAVVSCERAATVTCTVDRQFWGTFTLAKRVFNDVQGAEVNQRCKTTCTYWVEVITPTGNTPIIRLLSASAASRQTLAQDITRFVQTPTATTFQGPSFGYGSFLLLPVSLILLGLAMIVASLRKRWALARQGGVVGPTAA